MAFTIARDLAVDFERVAATAVVDAISVTETALGSPLPEAQKPNEAAPGPGATFAAHASGLTVTVLPLRLTEPLQLCVIATVLGSVNVSFQPVDVAVPLLATLKLRQKPLAQVESFSTVAAKKAPPGIGVGVGVGVVPPPGV